MFESTTERRVFGAAVLVIAATYGYFLIFAEFAFLELLRETGGVGRVRLAMGLLGVAGVAGSGLAAWRFRVESYAKALRWGAFGCALAAGLAWCGGLNLAAVGIGLSLGWLTVTLAAGLRATVGPKRLGLAIGLGTGLAYAACNVPAIFRATPQAQTGLALGLMLAAVVATRGLRTGRAEVSSSGDFEPRRAAAWTVILMALVWMDSAAFYIIQHTSELRAGTWGEERSLWVNATIHFVVAVGTGVVLDRGGLGRVVCGAWVMLACACVLLGEQLRAFVGAEVLYTAGVSLYSVALVYYPARGGRAWLAGVVFAIAGWVGSALGIGMAQDLNAVPLWFVIVAGVIVVGLLLARRRAQAKHALAVAAVIGLGSLTFPATSARAADAEVLRGREVFIGEGCIHCHSQYLRPRTADVMRWGPEKPLAASLAETPPLLGNRRQGPDLTQVGNRRSREWNKLHLIDPRGVSPGSRMPSYAYLFQEGDGRGEALLVYLASLGVETDELRATQVGEWAPAPGVSGRRETGARLFTRLCMNCHGAEGKGDGVMAMRLSVRPPDWSRDAWRRVDAADEAGTLARIIKFGLPGSPMAGHEYLRDEEVVSLAAYVRSLRGTGP